MAKTKKRPRNATRERLDGRQLSLPLSIRQREILEKAATAEGRTLSEWARRILLKAAGA